MTTWLALALIILMAHTLRAATSPAQSTEPAAQTVQGVAPTRDADASQGQTAAPAPTPARQQSTQPLQTSQSSGWYWLQIFGAASVGAVVVKLLDILWLTPATWRAEHRKWLRDQRLAAYAEVARDILSFRLGGGQDHENPFQAYAVASRAILLAHSDDLAKRIDQFIVDLDRFYRLDSAQGKEAEAETQYKELSDRARNLVSDLRGTLIER